MEREMNERIRELMKQADIFENQYSVEKFAKLIVKECVTAITDDQLAKDCDTFLMQSWAKGMRYSAEVIKEHFGFEC
jgi:hypothetical protein